MQHSEMKRDSCDGNSETFMGVTGASAVTAGKTKPTRGTALLRDSCDGNYKNFLHTGEFIEKHRTRGFVGMFDQADAADAADTQCEQGVTWV